MKEIILTQGFKTQVDDYNYDWLNQWKWCIARRKHTIYAVNYRWVNKKSKIIYMHRLILNIIDSKIQGEHKDRNGLNNQESNLRVATLQQNNMNRGANKKNISGFKGVHIYNGHINSHIRINGKSQHIGSFKTIETAARAYDKKAKELFGEFAYLNFK